MKINEIQVVVQLKKDIPLKKASENISYLLLAGACLDEELRYIHKESRDKIDYVFNTLKPFEKDGIYRKNRIYTFTVRTKTVELAQKIIKGLNSIKRKNEYPTDLEIIAINFNKKYFKDVNFVSVQMPLQVPEKSGTDICLLPKDYFKLIKRLNETTVYKYNMKNPNSDIPMDFELFKTGVLKQNPVLLHFRELKMKGVLGTFEVDMSEQGQKLVEWCLNTGIGAKSSLMGSGYLEPVRNLILKESMKGETKCL